MARVLPESKATEKNVSAENDLAGNWGIQSIPWLKRKERSYALSYHDYPIEHTRSRYEANRRNSSSNEQQPSEDASEVNVAQISGSTITTAATNSDYVTRAVVHSAGPFSCCCIWLEGRNNEIRQQLNVLLFRIVGISGPLLPVYEWTSRSKEEKEEENTFNKYLSHVETDNNEQLTTTTMCLSAFGNCDRNRWVLFRGTDRGQIELCKIVLRSECFETFEVLEWMSLSKEEEDKNSNAEKRFRITAMHAFAVTLSEPICQSDRTVVLVCSADCTGNVLCQLVQLQIGNSNNIRTNNKPSEFSHNNPQSSPSVTITDCRVLYSVALNPNPTIGITREIKSAITNVSEPCKLSDSMFLLCGSVGCGILKVISNSHNSKFDVQVNLVGSKTRQSNFLYDITPIHRPADQGDNDHNDDNWDRSWDIPSDKQSDKPSFPPSMSSRSRVNPSIVSSGSTKNSKTVPSTFQQLFVSTRPKQRLWISDGTGAVRTTLKLPTLKLPTFKLPTTPSVPSSVESLEKICDLGHSDILSWHTVESQSPSDYLSIINLESAAVRQRLRWPLSRSLDSSSSSGSSSSSNSSSGPPSLPSSLPSCQFTSRQILNGFWDRESRRLTLVSMRMLPEQTVEQQSDGSRSSVRSESFNLLCMSQITIYTSVLSLLIHGLRILLFIHYQFLSSATIGPASSLPFYLSCWLPSLHRTLSDTIACYTPAPPHPHHSGNNVNSNVLNIHNKNNHPDFSHSHFSDDHSRSMVRLSLRESFPSRLDLQQLSSPPPLTNSEKQEIINLPQPHISTTKSSNNVTNPQPSCNTISQSALVIPTTFVTDSSPDPLIIPNEDQECMLLQSAVQLLHAVVQVENGKYLGKLLPQTVNFAVAIERLLISHRYKSIHPSFSISPTFPPLVFQPSILKDLSLKSLSTSKLQPLPQFCRWRTLFQQSSEWAAVEAPTTSEQESTTTQYQNNNRNGSGITTTTRDKRNQKTATRNEAMDVLDSLSSTIKKDSVDNTSQSSLQLIRNHLIFYDQVWPQMSHMFQFMHPHHHLSCRLESVGLTRSTQHVAFYKLPKFQLSQRFTGLLPLRSQSNVYSSASSRRNYDNDDTLVECLIPDVLTLSNQPFRKFEGLLLTATVGQLVGQPVSQPVPVSQPGTSDHVDRHLDSLPFPLTFQPWGIHDSQADLDRKSNHVGIPCCLVHPRVPNSHSMDGREGQYDTSKLQGWRNFTFSDCVGLGLSTDKQKRVWSLSDNEDRQHRGESKLDQKTLRTRNKRDVSTRHDGTRRNGTRHDDGEFHVNIKRRFSDSSIAIERKDSPDSSSDVPVIPKSTSDTRILDEGVNQPLAALSIYPISPTNHFTLSDEQAIEYIRVLKMMKSTSGYSDMEICVAMDWLPGILHIATCYQKTHRRGRAISPAYRWWLTSSLYRLLRERSMMCMTNLPVQSKLKTALAKRRRFGTLTIGDTDNQVDKLTGSQLASSSLAHSSLSICKLETDDAPHKSRRILPRLNQDGSDSDLLGFPLVPRLWDSPCLEQRRTPRYPMAMRKENDVWRSSQSRLPRCQFGIKQRTNSLEGVATTGEENKESETEESNMTEEISVDQNRGEGVRLSWKRRGRLIPDRVRKRFRTWRKEKNREESKPSQDIWDCFPSITKLALRVVLQYQLLNVKNFVEFTGMTERGAVVIQGILTFALLHQYCWNDDLGLNGSSDPCHSESTSYTISKIDLLQQSWDAQESSFQFWRRLSQLLLALQFEIQQHAVLRLHFNSLPIEVFRLAVLSRLRFLLSSHTPRFRHFYLFLQPKTLQRGLDMKSQQQVTNCFSKRCRWPPGIERRKRLQQRKINHRSMMLLWGFYRGRCSLIKSMIFHLIDKEKSLNTMIIDWKPD